MTFFQIVSQYCGGVLNPPWPKSYARIARKFDVINLNFVSLAAAACAVKTSYFMKLFAMTAGPMCVSVAIGLIFVVGRIRIIMLSEADDPYISEDVAELDRGLFGESSQAQLQVAGAELSPRSLVSNEDQLEGAATELTSRRSETNINKTLS